MIYQEFGALVEFDGGSGRPPFAAQDCLVPASRLERVGNDVVFAWENQGNWCCRCALGQENPPVFCNDEQLSESGTEFKEVSDRLSRFLTTLCLHEAVYSAPYLVTLHERPTPDTFTAPLRPLWLRGPYISAEPYHSFYDIPGEDILILGYPEPCWVASHSNALFRLVRRGTKIYQLSPNIPNRRFPRDEYTVV